MRHRSPLLSRALPCARWLSLACCLAAFASPSRAHAADIIVPPHVRTQVAPVWPSTVPNDHDLDVIVIVTVAADGAVLDAHVDDSMGAEYDNAAIDAVKHWQFEPATRNGQPIPARVRALVHFETPRHAPPPPPVPTPAPPEAPDTAAPAPPSATNATVAVPAQAPESAPSGAPAAHPAQAAQAEITVHGQTAPVLHGASDFQIPVGALRSVPRANASDYLKLAPGILLTNEGGDGHAEQVFLRGFDAREGQDIEFSVDGVPFNDSGNLHGNGYADTHFIIPELILGLHVTEGPFSPRQGNYSVAGSADYHLGLETRGLTAKATYGSWNSERLLLLWGPQGESSHTFGGAEAYKTDGYGVNRASSRGAFMGQYEIALPSGATLRVGGQGYATHFQTAGVIRQDDYEAGRVGFFGTEDPLQGGDASRFSLYANYDKGDTDSAVQQSLFLIRRDMRLREDFTGFLLDTQNVLDTLHAQRGDLIDMNFGAWTLGGGGFGRWSTLLGGLKQSIDLGYAGRIDLTDSTQYRDTVPGNIPYRLETDLQSTITDLGLFADASLRPLAWLSLRGGLRLDTFSYNVLNNCAAQGDFDNPSKTQPPTNQSCHDQIQFGAHREPVQRSSTGAAKVMPRATATFGPFGHFNLSLSYGEGVRSIDPTYISQDLDTPFASVRAYEGGVTYANQVGPFTLTARSVFFETKVDRDLVFSQTEGRNVLANGTTRLGWAGALRLANSFFDDSANLTLVRPTFDDTHLEIPYIPTLVFREDAALNQALPWKIGQQAPKASLAVGWTYVGRRALPYNEVSDVISVVDASAALRLGGSELSLAITNLFDVRYRLGEFYYASDFHSQPEPTLVPARHFSAGAPRGIFLSFSSTFGGAS